MSTKEERQALINAGICPSCEHPFDKEYPAIKCDMRGCNEQECSECMTVCPESDIATCGACYEEEYIDAQRQFTPSVVRQLQLDKLQQDDPVGFYLACKDDPGRIDEMLG